MRIPSGKTDVYLYFVAVDSTDLKTRETGLSSFTVYRSRNGAAEVAYTTPTITEIDATNMPGVYALLIDEDTTITSGADSEEVCVHITQASMAPVTRTFELYRPIITSGQTITVANGAADADLERIQGTVVSTPATAGILDVNVKNIDNDAASASGTVTFPNATLASTTNITAGTITTATNVTTVNGLASGVITATSIAADAITAAKIADGAIDANTFATGAITATAIAADAIGASELAADAATEIATAVWAAATRTVSAATNITSTGGTVPITAGGLVSSDVTAISTDTTAANNAESFFDGTGYAGTNNVIPTVTSVTNGVTVTTNNDKTGYALSAAGVDAIWDEATSGHVTAGSYGVAVTDILTDTAVIGAAGAGLTAIPWNASWDAEVQSECADALTAYGAATATDVTTAAANVSVDEIQASALADLFNTNSGTTYASAVSGSVVKEIADNAGGSSLTAADIADAVWDEAQSGHVSAGSFGEIATEIAAILVDTAEIGVAGAGLTNINLPDQTMNITGNITGNLSGSVGSVATGGITAASFAAGAIDNAAIATDAIGSNELAASAIAEIQNGLSNLSQADIRTAVGLASANLDTQLSTIDTVVDAVKVKTDSLTFTVAGQVDSNIQYVNDVQVTGDGQTGTEWGPA